MRPLMSLSVLLFAGVISPGNAAEMNPLAARGGPLSMDAMSGASPMRPHHGGTTGERAPPSPEAMLEKFGEKLNLDGQQRMDMQIIVADYQPRLADLAKIGRGIARDLMAISPDAPGYVDQSQASSAAAAAVTAEFVTLMAEMRGKLYSVLTAEQRERFKALVAEQRDKMREKIEAKKAPAE